MFMKVEFLSRVGNNISQGQFFWKVKVIVGRGLMLGTVIQTVIENVPVSVKILLISPFPLFSVMGDLWNENGQGIGYKISYLILVVAFSISGCRLWARCWFIRRNPRIAREAARKEVIHVLQPVLWRFNPRCINEKDKVSEFLVKKCIIKFYSLHALMTGKVK